MDGYLPHGAFISGYLPDGSSFRGLLHINQISQIINPFLYVGVCVVCVCVGGGRALF